MHVLSQRSGATSNVTQPRFVTSLRSYKNSPSKKVQPPFNSIPFKLKKGTPIVFLSPVASKKLKGRILENNIGMKYINAL